MRNLFLFLFVYLGAYACWCVCARVIERDGGAYLELENSEKASRMLRYGEEFSKYLLERNSSRGGITRSFRNRMTAASHLKKFEKVSIKLEEMNIEDTSFAFYSTLIFFQ